MTAAEIERLAREAVRWAEPSHLFPEGDSRNLPSLPDARAAQLGAFVLAALTLLIEVAEDAPCAGDCDSPRCLAAKARKLLRGTP